MLREEVAGVRFADFTGLPVEVFNQVTGALPDLLRRLLKPVADAFHHGIEENLDAVVANAIPSVLRGFGCELIGMLLTHVRGFMGTSIGCTEEVDGKRCEGRLEFERNQPTTVKTMVGEVRYSRAYYHGACGHSAFPVDALLGIDAQRMLPQVQEEMGLLSSQMPYEHALATLTRFTGMAMSKATVENATQALADEKRAEQEAERETAFAKEFRLPDGETPAGKVAFVSMDGGFCKIVGQQEEAEFKVGVLGSFVPVGDRTPDESPIQNRNVASRSLKPPPDILGKRYLGRFENAETFMERLAVEFHKAGLHKLDVVNVCSDGAEWIIGRTPGLVGSGQELVHVLDWYHSEERLGVLSKSVFGEAGAGQAEWIEKMCRWLINGKLPQFFSELTRQVNRALDRKQQKLAEELQANYDYFHKRRHLLRYKEALERGLVIGSGSAEGGIRFVGKDRLYRSGMKWHVLGAEEVLVLRCVWASGCWQQFQEQRRKKRLAAYKQHKGMWIQAMARAA
ncbi:MAG: ISKra4 family transposase [Candidatus Xenobia bacterium]